MAIILHMLIGLVGVQVFFLLSRGFGAPWGVFAPGASGRAGSLALAAGLIVATGVILFAAPLPAWGGAGVLLLWFLLLALDRDEGAVLLWRPVAGLSVALALAWLA